MGTQRLSCAITDINEFSVDDHIDWSVSTWRYRGVGEKFGEAAQSIDDIIVRPTVSRAADWTLDEVIAGDSFSDAFYEDLVLNGTSQPDRISGGLGNDLILGDWGEDVLFGLAGDDEILGGANYDRIYGGDGDDILSAGSITNGEQNIWLPVNRQYKYDELFGGDGDDFLIAIPYGDQFKVSGVKYPNSKPSHLYGGPGDDVYDGFYSVVFEEEDEGFDTLLFVPEFLFPNVEAIIFDTMTYADVVGNALDNLIISTYDPSESAEAPSDIPITVRGLAGDDFIIGSAQRNVLDGGDGDDLLDGGDGADEMIGGFGDDYFVIDTLEDVVTETADGGNDTVEVLGDLLYLLPDHVENIVLGESALNATGNDEANQLFGNSANNALRGEGGYDVLVGEAGDDALDGGDGADEMRGGLGNDLYFVSDPDDVVTEEAGEGFDSIYSTVIIALPDNVEYFQLLGDVDGALRGRAGDDVIWAGDGTNVLKGFGGRDKLYGEGGDDVLIGHAGRDRLEGGDGADLIGGGDDDDVGYGGSGADQIWGGDGLDSLIGDDGDDLLNGGADNDRIWAGLGNDKVLGGPGDDRAWGGAGDDDISGNAGVDILRGEAGADRINGGDGDDVVIGDAGNDDLIGGIGVDRIYGGEGDDTLSGGAGADRMWGGLGNDTYVVDDANDRLREFAGAGDDTIIVQTDVYRAFVNVELVTVDWGDGATVYGTAHNDFIIGDVGNDVFKGGRGHDALDGVGGDDILIGHGGYDLLKGGDGDDVLIGGAGRDHLHGGAGVDAFVFDVGDEFDRVYDFEPGQDTLNFQRRGLASFEAFSDAARTMTSGDLIVDFGDGDIILVYGVAELDLSAADVII